MRILRLFVSAAETDEACVNFDLFSLCERNLCFGSEFLGDGVRADVERAPEKPAVFEKKDVCGFSPNIEQERATFKIAVIVAKCVAQRRGTGIEEIQFQTGGVGRSEK